MPLYLAGRLEVETLVAHGALDRLGLQLLHLGRVLDDPGHLFLGHLGLEPFLVGRDLNGRVGRHGHPAHR